VLNRTERPFFITIFKESYLPVISRLNDESDSKNIMVIHDHRDMSEKVVPFIKNKWKLVSIRKTVAEYLSTKYSLESLFLYHPFYPYSVDSKTHKRKKAAVSISRISFEKNTDIIIKANNLLSRREDLIKLYGCASRMYVHLSLGRYNGDFGKYYCGIFDKSFSAISNLLAGVKFVVDLSVLKQDGGGTQYTFLEAIHNDCALILHRKWIENVKPEYCDFKEGYNCFAVENEKELADLIRKDPDTTKIVQNAKKLIDRHINIKSEWSKL
jgi:glycosyltransferase involved in cell wall biosynthesis